MKQLILIRHAKSTHNNTGLSDFDRPLHQQGEREAADMGKRLYQRAMPIDGIISSPAKRALSTAHIIAEETHFNTAHIIEEARIYEATFSTLFAIAQDFDERFAHLLMFGHNPGMSLFAYYLSGYTTEMPTCAMLAMQFEIECWADIQPSSGTVLFFDAP